MKKTVICAALVALVGAVAFAATSVTVQTVSESGVTPTRTSTGLVTTVGGYKFRNDGKTFLLFEKTGAGTATISFGAAVTYRGLAISSRTLTVDATAGDRVIGPFPANPYNDGNGDVIFTISDTVGLSMAVIRLQ